MIPVADIFRLHGPQYRATFGDRMPRSHRRAMQDIQQCRTEALGGQVYYCDHCQAYHYSFHSCKNRHCPTCQNDQAQLWLETQQCRLLPVTHFLVTFTLPDQLRAVARSHQKTIYSILFRASSEALQELALDPRFIGGRIGMVGVLQTWTRDLRYPPHVHYIVTGGGLSADGQWLPSRHDFLVPVKPLSVIFRAKVRDHLKKTDLGPLLDERVWTKDGVVYSQPVGTGEPAFRYLAPYIFRVAISNTRILRLVDGQVTFQYKDSATVRSEPARSRPKSLFVGFFSRCSQTDSSKCDTTACSARPTASCSTKPENGWASVRSNLIDQDNSLLSKNRLILRVAPGAGVS